MSLAEQVFETFADRLGKRSDAIARFVASEYSFEEWINWEFFDAAKAGRNTCCPKPRYPKPNDRFLGDLLVSDQVSSVFCEVALVHDKTGWKWTTKINQDGLKLNEILQLEPPPHDTLQCVVVASKKTENWDADNDWKRFRTEIGWDVRSNLSPKVIDGEGVRVEMRGWVNHRTKLSRA